MGDDRITLYYTEHGVYLWGALGMVSQEAYERGLGKAIPVSRTRHNVVPSPQITHPFIISKLSPEGNDFVIALLPLSSWSDVSYAETIPEAIVAAFRMILEGGSGSSGLGLA